MTEYNKEKELMDYHILHGGFLDDFIKRDEIFQRWHDLGANHMFLQMLILPAKEGDNHITIEKICSIDCDNTQEYYLTALFNKCHQYNLTPAIKLMLDARLTLDFVSKNKEGFFREYKEIIKHLLDCDTNKYIDTLLIGNETTLIRKYGNLKSYWKALIDWIHSEYPHLKISASQYSIDMQTGEYDIADIIDFVGINRYPSDSSWPDTPKTEEMLSAMYDSLIYSTQEFCRNNNKDFLITECGVSHWSGQCREPELGNSMINFYGKGYDFQMQANYIKAALIAAENMKYCKGICILCGGDYDPLYKFNFSNPYKGELIDNGVGFEVMKSVWGEKNE